MEMILFNVVGVDLRTGSTFPIIFETGKTLNESTLVIKAYSKKHEGRFIYYRELYDGNNKEFLEGCYKLNE